MKTIAAAAALAGSLLFVGASSAATIYSEDFSGYSPLSIARNAHGATSTSGNTITTSYSYRVPNGQNHNGQLNSMWNEGTWTIGTNPNAVHNLWLNMPLNTDPFLMLNGDTTVHVPQALAWASQKIDVNGGSYEYSYDLLNLCCAHSNGVQSFLQLEYFGGGGFVTPVLISSIVSSPSTPGGFSHVTGTFFLPSAGQIRLGLTDTSLIKSGNDFGVDNISLASAPEPASWALMILGFGGLGASLRRRRAALA